jgi:hypothetical protein
LKASRRSGGIGPAYDKKLLRAFGEKVFDGIEATHTDCVRSTASVRYEPAASPPPIDAATVTWLTALLDEPGIENLGVRLEE